MKKFVIFMVKNKIMASVNFTLAITYKFKFYILYYWQARHSS